MNTRYAIRLLAGFLRGLVITAFTVLALLGLVCGLIVMQGRRDEAQQVGGGRVGAALVLGAAQWNGDPSPVLRARLDHALELYRRGQVRQIILTGGTGSGDTISEAAAGKQYLIEHGIAADALLLEEHGTTTWESLRNAVPLARANRIGAVLLVSDPFHMLRSIKMARDLGLIAYGSPTRTSPISVGSAEEMRYVLREAWAYLVYLFMRQ
ncbi:MAG TPA: YdcF family protein [Roseiflexaceae bacterium]|nr:YdcF family protein [Roseiflexaceae bacterium]